MGSARPRADVISEFAGGRIEGISWISGNLERILGNSRGAYRWTRYELRVMGNGATGGAETVSATPPAVAGCLTNPLAPEALSGLIRRIRGV